MSKLRSNSRDADGLVIPELGFGFSAWNGASASVTADMGAYGLGASNAVVLDIDDGDGPDNDDSYRRLLEALVETFEPEHGVVTRYDWLVQAGSKEPWEAGLFTYAKGTGIQCHGVSFRR